MSGMNFLEKLLDGVAVEWKPLGDERFVEVENSKRKPVKASLRLSGKTPYYGANNIQDYVEGFTHDGEFVLIAEDGSASLENYSIQYANGKFWANNHVHVVLGTPAVSNSKSSIRYKIYQDKNQDELAMTGASSSIKSIKCCHPSKRMYLVRERIS